MLWPSNIGGPYTNSGPIFLILLSLLALSLVAVVVIRFCWQTTRKLQRDNITGLVKFMFHLVNDNYDNNTLDFYRVQISPVLENVDTCKYICSCTYMSSTIVCMYIHIYYTHTYVGIPQPSSLETQLLQQLPKRMIFAKDQVHLGNILGQGVITYADSVYLFCMPQHGLSSLTSQVSLDWSTRGTSILLWELI